jgi:hypothetical protein
LKSAAAQTTQPSAKGSIKVENTKAFVETPTLSAVIDKGLIVSLKSKPDGEEFIKTGNSSNPTALQILYPGEETVNVNEEKFGNITARRLSDTRAEFRFKSWDGDGVVTFSVDSGTGDLVVEPSACSSRPGVRACRWNVAGIRPDLRLVAPFFQGVNLDLNDTLVKNTRWEWPMYWEAGLVLFQGKNSGFWIHTQDTGYRYKSLKLGSQSDPYCTGFDTESYGPSDANLSAGGLAWRVNVFRGDWKVPAERYRQWYWEAYNLDAEERKRQPWMYDVRFAVCWCPGSPEILDALAKRLPPSKVLLHFPNWRTDNYDENYPTYVASDKGKAFIKKCQEMGFRIMPHFNSIDMDPSNPAYAQIRDFQYRTIEKKQLLGWSWYKSRGIGVPESNANRSGNRDKKVMVKVHPALSMWRSILGENILKAVEENSLDAIFIDVTLHSYNLYNCLVESTTSSEGMKRLIEHVASLNNGLVVGGEGLNEITAQGQSFAQAHLFKSWQTSIPDIARTGGIAFNEFLLGKLCRTVGYNGLSGRSKDDEIRMQIHVEHGAIPTVTINSAKDITDPNPAVKHMLELAGQ